MNQTKALKTMITRYLPSGLHHLSDQEFENITEIRLRTDKPILLNTYTSEYTLTDQGLFTKNLNQGQVITKQDIAKTIELISNFSMYSFEKEVRNGYITLNGGHRVGISGTTVIEDGQVKTMKDFNGINVRIARQVFGASNKCLPYLMNQEGKPLHSLIISPPACGKTTMLRDAIRQLSYGDDQRRGISVGVVDERQEIAASYRGVPQNDLGPRTDVLDSCPKSVGMMILLRAMSPQVIAVDELGTAEDIVAVETIMNSGVAVIATAHGRDIRDIKRRKSLQDITEKKIFERYIVLKPGVIGQIKKVYDQDFQEVTRC